MKSPYFTPIAWGEGRKIWGLVLLTIRIINTNVSC